ncbi:hypothetical protein Tco_1066261 [Tanacetum coccineum]|uniref:RNA-directed DNA polymerase, eukaryota, reverse transcriptase zinc-binding domain protein n=1 Tax=Tanacetum coccineum TaxID=301880 RepID=A0ABQ5HAC5_9ASTR
MKDEENLLFQKAKIKWLSVGDRNNAYFNKVLKSRNHKSRIHQVRDNDGNMFQGNVVAGQFVKHFQEFLGSDVPVKDFEASCHLIKRKLSIDATNFMVKDVEAKQEILECVPFKVEKLLVKYLGVPLTSKRLRVNNCKILLDKIKSIILNWKNKCLSYAGRLQLIASVLESIHVYWASVFLLPKIVINDINSLLKGFLWNQGELAQEKSKVA